MKEETIKENKNEISIPKYLAEKEEELTCFFQI